MGKKCRDYSLLWATIISVALITTLILVAKPIDGQVLEDRLIRTINVRTGILGDDIGKLEDKLIDLEYELKRKLYNHHHEGLKREVVVP